MDKTEVVTQNCLAVKLKSASNQEIEIAFVYNPNDESDKISNLRKALDHMADNGVKNQMIIGDYNSLMNFEIDYVDYTGDPQKASRNFLHGLQEDGVYIDVYRFLYPYDYSYTLHVPGTLKDLASIWHLPILAWSVELGIWVTTRTGRKSPTML